MSLRVTKDKQIGIKICLIGDPKVGKSALIEKFTLNKFRAEYTSTILENYTSEISLEEFKLSVTLNMWDCSGEDTVDTLRPLAYHSTNIFLLCFSLSDRRSFSNLIKKWIPELKEEAPNVPVLLVGCQADIPLQQIGKQSMDALEAAVSGASIDVVDTKEAQVLALNMGAFGYVECSSLTGDGISEIFQASIRYHILSTMDTNLLKKRKNYSKLTSKNKNETKSAISSYRNSLASFPRRSSIIPATVPSSPRRSVTAETSIITEQQERTQVEKTSKSKCNIM